LINCLAADVLLRNHGRRLTEYHEEFIHDLSEGRGQAALDTEFAEFAKYYGSFDRQPSRASDGEGTNS
jgi:hypothetical protein